MNANERELDYCFADRIPEPGTVLQVAPNIAWIRMPLPFALDHINLWLIRDVPAEPSARVSPFVTASSSPVTHSGTSPQVHGDGADLPPGTASIVAQIATEKPGASLDPGYCNGWTVVDCGIGDAATQAYWETILASSLDEALVHRVLCTHFHPDHFGSADWMCNGAGANRWQARLWMTLGEYATGRLFAEAGAASDAGGAIAAAHMRRHGFADAVALEQIAHKAAYYPQLVPAVPQRFRRLHGDDVVRLGGHDWRVIIGEGHSPEHAALYSATLNVLIAGDMVLPRISTNVSVSDLEPEGDPLGAFLASLHAYDDLPADTLVLPSHGKPFRGLPIRLRQLHEHHAARLTEVLEACRATPCCAADIVPIMFRRPLDAHQMTFALGEALAHLHYLWHRGVLRREEDALGIWRFAVTAP